MVLGAAHGPMWALPLRCLFRVVHPRSQGASSGGSPVQLLVMAAACLVVWEQLKDLASFKPQKTCWDILPSLSPSHGPSPVPLASQPGSPCLSWSMLPPRMLCEVSSMETWHFQQVFEPFVAVTPLNILSCFFLLKEPKGLDFYVSCQETLHLQLLCVSLD